MKWLSVFLKSLNGFFNFISIKNPNLVVYFEGKQDVPHLLPIIENLKKINISPIIVSSEYLEISNCIFIGSGFFRILFFQLLDCRLILMTMPDLDRLYIKRSKNPVKYAYVFHSLSSSHTIYHEQAFDAYDIIYAAGPHHLLELKKREEIFSLKNKIIIEGGYPRIDSLILKNKLSKNNRKSITIAPTWGSGSLIEGDNAIEILSEILSAGFNTFLRLHPMTIRHHPQLVKKIKKRLAHFDNLFIETDMANKNNLYDSFMMISDWSGAAFEFSFTQNRPILFMNTSQKINNSNYQTLNLPIAELEIRKDIGQVVDLNNISQIKNVILDFYENQELWSEKLSKVNNKYIYNLGKSAEIIAKDLINHF